MSSYQIMTASWQIQKTLWLYGKCKTGCFPHEGKLWLTSIWDWDKAICKTHPWVHISFSLLDFFFFVFLHYWNHRKNFWCYWWYVYVLSSGFPRQEYWSELFPPPEALSDQGLNLRLLWILHWQAGSLPLSHLGNPIIGGIWAVIVYTGLH